MSVAYEELLRTMLEQVQSNVDKREGSIIYDALAPCAYFLAQQDFQLENFIDLVFADTAVGSYLDRAAAAYGVERKPATAAIRTMKSSSEVAIGSRWGVNELVYKVTKDLGSQTYETICETPGEIGNQYSGDLQPVSDGISGVTATLEDIVTAGTDEETDEALRERFYAKVRLPATSGNAYHYQQWALEVAGAGAAKVFPLDKGPGTVTVLVVDSDKSISPSLPETVAEYIETVRPIGATVTVENPEPLTINISANVFLDGSKSISSVQADYEEAVDVFLKGMVFESYRVSYARLASLLLDMPGVDDFENFLLNSSTGNVEVGDKQIPVKGAIALTEVNTLGIDEASAGLL